ncbi:MAG: enoyl-CoA hydratase/isomerase family protein [Sandaracinaceae bacterium]
MSDALVLRKDDGPVVTLTINRPDKLNALSVELLAALRGEIERLGGDRNARCLVITGAGKAFVAGADIAQMESFGPDEAREFSRRGHDVLAGLEALPIPVIAAVNGFALGGGCELALACDFIHASVKARFGQPEVRLGVVPGFGGTQRLARRVGVAHARELVYSGQVIGADEALRIGLVNRVHEAEQLLDAVNGLAAQIAKMGPLAVAAAKRVIRDGEGRTLPEANALEIEAFAGCFATADQKEGMSAVLEKRDPSVRAE